MPGFAAVQLNALPCAASLSDSEVHPPIIRFEYENVFTFRGSDVVPDGNCGGTGYLAQEALYGMESG